LTFKELKEEVIARGFENIATDTGGEARIKRWINQSYREVIDHRAWAFLEASKEGKAPLAIADLGHVLSVTNLTVETLLTYIERAALLHWDPALSGTGTGTQWYLENGNSIHVYPGDTASTILVRYLKEVADLVADGDEPVVPAAYHGVIEDGAVLRAYKTTDNFEAVIAIRAEFNAGLKSMVKGLRVNYDGSRTIVRTGSVNDYI
jgi:hypothetical protein